MKWILFSLILVFVGIGITPSIYAETVPDWVKNTAGWWATDAISETEFVNAIEFLINDGIIQVNASQSNENSQGVPDWVKNTAGWWATDAISEIEFVNAIEFLINDGIIKTETTNSCENDILKYFDDKGEISNICDEDNITNHQELIPYDTELKFNSDGFRGDEFSEEKSSNVYRIFMVGGSTMLGAETTNDTTISSIMQKMFDLEKIDKEIEVVNAGISGSTVVSEYNFIKSKIVNYDPDLIIMYDGWNDISADTAVKLIKNQYGLICQEAILNNFDLVMTLQPLPGFGNKILTEQEKINAFTLQDHKGYQFFQAKSTYDYLEREMKALSNESSPYNNCEMYNLRNIFDNVSGPIYYDGGHTLQAGNMILAEKFFEIAMTKINPSFQIEKPFSWIISKHNSEPVIKYLLNKIEITNHGFDQQLFNTLEIDHNKGKYFQLKNKHGDTSEIFVGKDLRKINLKNINLDGYDLSGANLSGQDLRGIDFSNIIIRGANLTYTNLEGVNLSGVDIRGVDFSYANMKNADFTAAIMGKHVQIYDNKGQCYDERSSLKSSILQANCMIEVFDEEEIITKFTNTNLQNAKFLTELNSQEQNFIARADFTNSDLSNAEITNTGFYNCKFNGSILDGTTVKGGSIQFLGGDFNDISMKNADFNVDWLHGTSFEDANIIDSNFYSELASFVNFKNTDFNGSNVHFEITTNNNNYSCKNNAICES